MAGDAPCVVGDPLEVHLVLWRPSYQYLTDNENCLGFAQIIFEPCEPLSQHVSSCFHGRRDVKKIPQIKHSIPRKAEAAHVNSRQVEFNFIEEQQLS
jgi:hypothetical protein